MDLIDGIINSLENNNKFYEQVIKDEANLNEKYIFLSLCRCGNTKHLKDICKFERGNHIIKKQIDRSQVNINNNLIGYHNKYNNKDTIFISLPNIAKYVSKVDSKILILDYISVIPNNEILNDYLYYYLKFIQKEIYEAIMETTQRKIYMHLLGILETLDIPIISLEQQQKLINSMKLSENKIKDIKRTIEDNNNRINELNEIVIQNN